MDSAVLEKILAILDEATDMTIATVRPDGYPQATAVGYVHDGVTLYFGTAGDFAEGSEHRFLRQGFGGRDAAIRPVGRDTRAFHGRPRNTPHRSR